MSIFRKNKKGDDAAHGDDRKNKKKKQEPFVPQPDTAQKWFRHGRTVADSTNYEYALSLYANGLKFDPASMTAHEAMLAIANAHLKAGGKPAPGKEVKKIDDGTPVGRFAGAVLAWMSDLNNGPLALKALEASIKAEQAEYGAWIAPMVLGLVSRGKKVTKAHLVNAKELFAEVGAFNEAIQAGEMAMKLDPTDSDLANEMKDLAAQRAISQGGYAESRGEEGGFRKFVKDADKQKELEESDAISGSQSVDERNLARAKKKYEDEPLVPESINSYAQLLKKNGQPDQVEEAYRVYMKGFQDTGEYRFRMNAGDIRIEQARRKVRTLEEKIESNGSGPELETALDTAKQEARALVTAEYRERVEKYPTDRQVKYQLGLVEFSLANYNEAMECFQKAKDEPRLRVVAGQMLGRCFAAEGWHDDAIAEFREALEASDVIEEERELEIRYDLMNSLLSHADAERSIDLAREAREICSSIARKNISFKDIRSKRKEVDALVKAIGG